MKHRKTIVTSVTLLLLFIVLAICVITGIAQGFNDNLYGRVEHIINPTLTTAAIWTSNIGSAFFYLPMLALLLIIPRTRVKIGLPVALTLAASAIANAVLKAIFAVDRPDVNRLVHAGGFGFPSGHAMNATVFFIFFAYLLARHSSLKPAKIAAAAAVLIVLLIGFSRIYLGVHTVTDVLGGYLAGVVILLEAGGRLLRLQEWKRTHNIE